MASTANGTASRHGMTRIIRSLRAQIGQVVSQLEGHERDPVTSADQMDTARSTWVL